MGMGTPECMAQGQNAGCAGTSDCGNDNYAAITPYDLAGCKRLVGIHIDRGAYEFQEDPTSIQKAKVSIHDKEAILMYNIAGQRLKKMQKGINIVNDKKIFRKKDVF